MLIEPIYWPEDDSIYQVDVLFTDVPEEERGNNYEFRFELLLSVTADHLEIYPLQTRQDRPDYLSSKYGHLKKIMITRPVSAPYELPATVADIEALLGGLPEGFSKDYRFGLGVLWEYRYICRAITEIEGIDTLFIHGGNEIESAPSLYSLGIDHFNSLRTELRRISTRYQRNAREDKELAAYNKLNHSADSKRFPLKMKQLRKDALLGLIQNGGATPLLSRSDRKAVIEIIYLPSPTASLVVCSH